MASGLKYAKMLTVEAIRCLPNHLDVLRLLIGKDIYQDLGYWRVLWQGGPRKSLLYRLIKILEYSVKILSSPPEPRLNLP